MTVLPPLETAPEVPGWWWRKSWMRVGSIMLLEETQHLSLILYPSESTRYW